MTKQIHVTYDSESLHTEITVDGKSFDTSRIEGREIADWAYPFILRKIRWNGFYDEMVEALDGEKEFDLFFDGSEEALAELQEAWEDAPVHVVSEKGSNVVVIDYDAEHLTTTITINAELFDTTRINGREIEDWIYPFMIRKIKWDGIFEEIAKVIETDKYEIHFSGSEQGMEALKEECPESVRLIKTDAEMNDTVVTQTSEDDLHSKLLVQLCNVLNKRRIYILKLQQWRPYFKVSREDIYEHIAALRSPQDGSQVSFAFLKKHLEELNVLEKQIDMCIAAIEMILRFPGYRPQVPSAFLKNTLKNLIC